MREKGHVIVSGGVSLYTVVLIVFLILKLTNVIDWSWWWVTAPLWMSIGLGIVLVLIYSVVLFCSYTARKHKRSKIQKK